MATIALNFEDGVTRFIENTEGETVAETAYRVGLNIPLDCADGACGTCKCLCLSGTYDGGNYIEDALSDEEAAKGFALACQMRPKSDVVIDILASSAACKMKVETISTVLTSVEFISSEIVKLKTTTKDGRKIHFLPGQYANIQVPGSDATRSYSFSNASGNSDLEFLIRLVNDGVMSNYLKTAAKAGDELNITGPFGSFYIREIKRPTLFFAGGTGIAPFLSMLEKLGADKTQSSVQLFYGSTIEENLVELKRLDTFKKEIPLNYYTSVSTGPSTTHKNGRVIQWITKEHLTQSLYDIYLCGPNAMVDSVKAALAESEIPYENFYSEKFLPTGAVPSA